jgi:hypothetical protein
MKQVLIGVALLALIESAYPVVYSGQDLKLDIQADAAISAHPLKASPMDRVAAAKAAGYIKGVADSLQHSVCISADTTPRQLMAAVSKFLDANAVVLSQSAYDSVVKALAAEFPCKRK